MKTTATFPATGRRSGNRRMTGVAAFWALAMAAALLFLLGRTPSTARAQDAPDAPDVNPAAASAISLTMTVKGNGATFVEKADVFNNALVTYRIRLQNGGAAALTNIRFESVMPSSGLDSIECPTCSDIITTTSTIINQLGDSEVVTVTRGLIWTPPGSLAIGATREVTFSARVVAQVGGPPIETSTLAYFTQGSAVSKIARLNVVADVPESAVITATAVSTTPSWYSSDLGGTLDLDWGDYDLDGDLDLVMASTAGASVYRNDNGQMTRIWTEPQAHATYGVRWLNVDAGGSPELVAIGTPKGAAAGSNYVYAFNPGTTASPNRFTVMANGQFDTVAQLTRLETGDFDGDGRPDLLVSVNAINAACPVLLLLNDPTLLFNGVRRCVSSAGSAALAAADVDGDGDPDVAMGLFPNQVRVFLNQQGNVGATTPLTITNPAVNTVFVDAPNYFLAYDFAWGDIDNDGDLDLVAAFPLQREVRLYRNMRIPARGAANTGNVSFQLIQPPLSTGVFLTPYAVDLGDMDRDGYLDLIVADQNPTIYWNTTLFAAPFSTSNLTTLDLQDDNAEIWGIRAIDQDGNGTLEISIANRSGPSLLLANYSPALSNKFTPIDGSGGASSLAWGDVNNDGLNDILLGTSSKNFSRLFYSVSGQFAVGSDTLYSADTAGAHVALLGDLGGATLKTPAGGQLDVLLDTPTGLILSTDRAAAQGITFPNFPAAGTKSAVLGDADGDGDLDLALASAGGALVILRNNGTGFDTAAPITVRNAPANIASLAWGDFNGDHYLDLAVGASAGASAVLINNSDLTFTAQPLSTLIADKSATCKTGSGRAAAWADVDGDGLLDLTMAFNLGANSGQVCVLHNTGKSLTVSRVFAEDALSLDWGDWDNDMDLDLAMARATAGARVYANIGGAFFPIWEGAANERATAARFGDKDGDGDLDLAIARADNNDSGIYENRSVNPVHLLTAAQASLLPVRSPYVKVDRPGITQSAYLYSSSEILAGPRSPTVTVTYRLYDPEGEVGDPAQAHNLIYAYSLDGGDNWLPATPMVAGSNVVTAALTRTGTEFKFAWNAMADKAIAENASFRVEIVNANGGQAVQKAAGTAASPPFQVRATTCAWPRDPRIFVDLKPVTGAATIPLENGQPYADLTFDSALVQGSGVMTFTWNFNDGTAPRNGQRIIRRLSSGTYNLTLTAFGKPCPETRSALTKVVLTVGTGTSPYYLPLVQKDASAASADAGVGAAQATAQATAEAQVYLPAIVTTPDTNAAENAPVEATASLPAPPAPLAALDGVEEGGRVLLTWQPPPPGSATELRVLRWPLNDPAQRVLEATLPAVVSSYSAAAECGMAYAVIAVNAEGASDMGSVYLLQACGEEVQ